MSIVDPEGTIYEGRWKAGFSENAENKGSHVGSANTGAVGIAIVGRYGSDPGFDDQLKSFFDGGDANPTSDAIDSTQSLIDWLSGKYSIFEAKKLSTS